MNLAIIPARGGSKRIPNKNIISFCGKPMLTYPVEVATKSNLFEIVHVSTDSSEIKKVVEETGLSIDFLRDKSLCDDYTGILPVLSWVTSEYEKQGYIIDSVCCIYSTTPFLQISDLKGAYKKFHDNNGDYPVMTVTEYPAPIEWAYHENERGFLESVQPDMHDIRSQDLPLAYYECASFFILNRVHLEIANVLSSEVVPYIISRERAVDIDTMEDLEFAERLYCVIEK